MTSLCRKNDSRPKFSATKFSFIKFISESSSKETNLKVPTSYVKKYQEKYGKELSKVVHLKLPCGTEWEVEVTGHNGHFWFEKGWEDFCKFYSLQSRDSLAFQYEANSRFKVNIFDKSKTEIDYPIKSPDMQENGVNDHSPPASPPLPQKKKEATSSGGKKDLSAEKDEGGKSSTTQRSQKPTTEVPMRMHSSAIGGKATALQRAKEFKSRNPSCFLVIMHASYIKGTMLWLSTEISMNMLTYLGQNSGNVSLRVSEGSTRGLWTVEMKYDTERATFRLQSGWNKFVQGNNLNAGDVCGFMLIDEIGLLFEVNIFRRTEVATSSPGYDEYDVDDKDDHGLHDANDDYAADENRHRSFRTVLLKSSISHCLWLCSRFSQKHLSDKPSNAELHVPGGTTTWCVGLKYEVGRKRAKFQSGWTKFVRDNNLNIGDECVFVLTDENIFSFEVVIVAAKSTLPPDIDDANDNIKDDEDNKNEDDDDTSDDEGDHSDDENDHSDEDDEYSTAQQLHKRKRSSSSTKSSIRDVGASTSTGQFLKRRPGVPRSMHPVRTTKNDIALQRAKVFKYVEPHFVVPMTARNVHESFLKLPSAFVQKHLDKRPSHVSLWGSNDIYWPVELHFSKGASFQGGWIEFVQRHNLKEGDACGFELTEKRKFLFDVHIFHTT
ncbi:B3 domain-containing protein LOC_Os12g40080 [Rosa chinensis]|uniref:B3 domain-containing protein LOC_Os12g40080 n=1 Tax=Rosa chinensis TaxID=74649 RepID=UPI001AD92C63|nr:B3 domain-containing protein LOC_Os12g40080 [Rosa chinensis]